MPGGGVSAGASTGTQAASVHIRVLRTTACGTDDRRRASRAQLGVLDAGHCQAFVRVGESAGRAEPSWEGVGVPHVICAPDKFRDALSARDAAAVMAAGAQQAGWTATPHPIADGGEGSREAVAASRGGEAREAPAIDPRGRPVSAPYLVLPDGTAVVAAADVIGLEQLAKAERDPMRCTSRGLAAPLLAAAADGVRRIVVFVGGVATVDGGLGLLAALGAAPVDDAGRAIAGTGADLAVVERVDLEAARRALGELDLVVASDVTSPLFGPTGAARIFGPQKGADAAA